MHIHQLLIGELESMLGPSQIQQETRSWMLDVGGASINVLLGLPEPRTNVRLRVIDPRHAEPDGERRFTTNNVREIAWLLSEVESLAQDQPERGTVK